jgi:hypothetical protein
MKRCGIWAGRPALGTIGLLLVHSGGLQMAYGRAGLPFLSDLPFGFSVSYVFGLRLFVRYLLNRFSQTNCDTKSCHGT